MAGISGLLHKIPEIKMDESKKKALLIYAAALLIIIIAYFYLLLRPSVARLTDLIPKLRSRMAEIQAVRADLPLENKLKEKNRLSAEKLKADPKAKTPLLIHTTLGKAHALAALTKLDQARPLFDEVLEKARRGSSLYREAAVALADVEFQRHDYSRSQVLYLEIGMIYQDEQLSPKALYWAGRCALELSWQAETDEEKQRHQRAAAATWRELRDRFPQTPFAKDAHRDAKRCGIRL